MARIKAVVLPVPDSRDYPFLSELRKRSSTFTTMIWGWQGEGSRMVGPLRILRGTERPVPFLFSPTDQDIKAVTHAAVAGVILHTPPRIPTSARNWLIKHRVEQFVVPGGRPGLGGKSAYLVSATTKVSPLEYPKLTLVSARRPLNPNKRRGYSIVYLPSALDAWYTEACAQWLRRYQRLPRPLKRAFADAAS